MTPTRRRFVRLAAGTGAATLAGLQVARAQSYPSRPVRIIVGFAPGGPTDILARLIGQWLAERLGQPFIVENRPGAGSNIAIEAVVRSPADGHTLLLFTPAAAINVSLFRNLSYNFIRDIAPVAGVLKAPNVLTVGSSLPVRTVPELIAYAKANPHKVNVGHTGNGTGAHLASELFKMLTGTELVMVPYRGNAPAFTDLISGHIHVMFPGPVGLLEHIQAGRLRALAVTSTTRSPALPEVLTLNEHVPGYETTQWYAIGAPRETPADIVTLLNREINAALQDSQINARIAEQGGSAMLGSPADLGKLIADETAKWAAVIERAGIKPE